MSIAENIKRAALGPAPGDEFALFSWCDEVASWEAVHNELRRVEDFWHLSNDERRMFLLFVAYSLGAK